MVAVHFNKINYRTCELASTHFKCFIIAEILHRPKHASFYKFIYLVSTKTQEN